MSKNPNPSTTNQANNSSLVYELIAERRAISSDYLRMLNFKKRAYQFAIHFDLIAEFELFMSEPVNYENDLEELKACKDVKIEVKVHDFEQKHPSLKEVLEAAKLQLKQQQDQKIPQQQPKKVIDWTQYCTVQEYCSEIGLIINSGENIRLSKVIKNLCIEREIEFLMPNTYKTVYPRTVVLEVIQREIFKPFPKAKQS